MGIPLKDTVADVTMIFTVFFSANALNEARRNTVLINSETAFDL